MILDNFHMREDVFCAFVYFPGENDGMPVGMIECTPRSVEIMSKVPETVSRIIAQMDDEVMADIAAARRFHGS